MERSAGEKVGTVKVVCMDGVLWNVAWTGRNLRISLHPTQIACIILHHKQGLQLFFHLFFKNQLPQASSRADTHVALLPSSRSGTFLKTTQKWTKVHSRAGCLWFYVVKGSLLRRCLMIHKSPSSQYRQEMDYLVLPLFGTLKWI